MKILRSLTFIVLLLSFSDIALSQESKPQAETNVFASEPNTQEELVISRGVGGMGAIPLLGALEFGALKVGSFCQESNIIKALQQSRRDLKYCYHKELTRTPNLHGEITLHIIIGLNGAVFKSWVAQDALNHEGLKGCLLRSVKRIRFTRPRGGLCQMSQVLTFKRDKQSKTL